MLARSSDIYPPFPPLPGSREHERRRGQLDTDSRFDLREGWMLLALAWSVDRCTMTLCDENGSLALLAVEVDIIRETLSHTLGTRKDTAAAYGQGQLESRRTATMLVCRMQAKIAER